jgi:hypothetical protein
MQKRALRKEAELCRRLARQYAGRPEEPFLLRIAGAMDELAIIEPEAGLHAPRRPKA